MIIASNSQVILEYIIKSMKSPTDHSVEMSPISKPVNESASSFLIESLNAIIWRKIPKPQQISRNIRQTCYKGDT